MSDCLSNDEDNCEIVFFREIVELDKACAADANELRLGVLFAASNITAAERHKTLEDFQE